MKRTFLFLCLAFCCQCISSSDDRATFDEEVGRASTAEGEVVIDDGLAAVRELSAGEVTLWTSAPAWSGSITIPVAGRWRFVVDNALRDAELVVEASGMALPVTASTRARATQRVFELETTRGAGIASIRTARHR